MALYSDFFGLKESPFDLTPDPGFLYLSRSHEEALESLKYGIKMRSGFMLVTGEVGTGKTTISRALLTQLDKTVDTSLILNPSLNERDLLSAIVHDFGLTRVSGEKGDLLEALNHFLLAGLTKGRNAVLIIDEAQNLPLASMETVRMISNLETEKKKLIQIILVGQPELNNKLGNPDLRQMDQRIAVRVRLEGLMYQETRSYIHHRLSVAGARENSIIFANRALGIIHKNSGGYPRLINSFCDRALLAAYVKETRAIGPALARAAVREVLGIRKMPVQGKRFALIPVAWSFMLVLGVLIGLIRQGGLPFPSASAPRGLMEGEPAANVEERSTLEGIVEGAVQPSIESDREERFFFEEGGLVRTNDPAATPLASLAALLRLSGLEHLASEVGIWRVMNFEPQLLSVFFKGTNIIRQYNLGILTGSSLEAAIRINAPFMVLILDSSKIPHYSVISEMAGERLTLLDPLEGMMTVSRDILEKIVSGPPVFVLPGFPVGGALRRGQRGSNVMKLQELLHEAGYYADIPDGIYGSRVEDAVRRLQADFDLQKTGIAHGETLLVATRLSASAQTPQLRRKTKTSESHP